jgi:hypothetical protein
MVKEKVIQGERDGPENYFYPKMTFLQIKSLISLNNTS